MASSFLAVTRPVLHSSPRAPPPHRHFPPSSSLASPSVGWGLAVSRGRGLRVRASAAVKWEPAKVVPQSDRVLIQLEELPEKSTGGVLLPKSAVKFERYLMGEILSVGSDVGEVEAGKKVLFSDINAYEVDLGTDAKHCFCRAGDLLAVVE